MLPLLTALLPAGCGEADQKDFVVLSGGSMRTPIERLATLYEETYGEKVTCSFGGSGVLLSQIRTSQRGDVFCGHDPFGPLGVDFGAFEDAQQVAVIKPVLIVNRENDSGVRTLGDLARPGLKVGLPDYDRSTGGQIVRAMLRRAGLFEGVNKNRAASYRMHSSIATALELGHLDAGVVWDAIANYHHRKLIQFPIEEKYEVDSITSPTGRIYQTRRIKVTLSVINYSSKKEQARRFIALARSEAGRRIWIESGFKLAAPATATSRGGGAR